MDYDDMNNLNLGGRTSCVTAGNIAHKSSLDDLSDEHQNSI